MDYLDIALLVIEILSVFLIAFCEKKYFDAYFIKKDCPKWLVFVVWLVYSLDGMIVMLIINDMKEVRRITFVNSVLCLFMASYIFYKNHWLKRLLRIITYQSFIFVLEMIILSIGVMYGMNADTENHQIIMYFIHQAFAIAFIFTSRYYARRRSGTDIVPKENLVPMIIALLGLVVFGYRAMGDPVRLEIMGGDLLVDFITILVVWISLAVAHNQHVKSFLGELIEEAKREYAEWKNQRTLEAIQARFDQYKRNVLNEKSGQKFRYGSKTEQKIVMVSDIVSVSAFDKKQLITFADGSQDSFRGTLWQTERQLNKEVVFFIKINRSDLVNYNYITEIRKGECVVGDQAFRIPEGYQKEVERKYGECVKGEMKGKFLA